jgi:hypothetical protein
VQNPQQILSDPITMRCWLTVPHPSENVLHIIYVHNCNQNFCVHFQSPVVDKMDPKMDTAKVTLQSINALKCCR